MLEDKCVLITGVVTPDSIAAAIAQRAQHFGARVLLTAPLRDLERAQATADRLGCGLFELDVTRPSDWEALDATVTRDHPRLDGAVHAVAYAPRDALDGTMTETDPAGLSTAFHTSTISYATLAGFLARHAPNTGAGLVGLDFDASRAWPTYNWMGVCKAALEATNRYLARDFGPRNIRTNLVAAGPVRTRAASAIPGFDLLIDAWDRQAPLTWDPDESSPVADVVCFLLSDLARTITGEIVHADAGMHAVATTLADRHPSSANSPTEMAETRRTV